MKNFLGLCRYLKDIKDLGIKYFIFISPNGFNEDERLALLNS